MAQSGGAIRAITFVMLVIGNLGVIHANLSFSQPYWRRVAPASSMFTIIAVAATTLMTLVLTILALRAFFSLLLPSWPLVAVALAGLALSLEWFEAVNTYLRGNRKSETTIAAPA